MCGPEGNKLPAAPYATQPSLRPSTVTGAGAGVYRLESFPLEFEGYVYEGWIAYAVGRGPSPLVMVYPNYAGLKQFDKDQAMFMAKLGYVGLAVDLYKEKPGYGKEDRNPIPNVPVLRELKDPAKYAAASKSHLQHAFEAMNDCLRDPRHWRALMATYLERARAHPAVHPRHAGAIGYCFGGQCILEMVRAGHGLDGVVSFHGLLQSEPNNLLDDPKFDAKKVSTATNSYNAKCKVLIENGDVDDHVPDASISRFKEEMDAQHIDWRFHNHAQTPHGFALPPGVFATA